MDLKSRIGERSDSFEDEVDSGKIEAFCKAVGARARESGAAPPTFLTRCRDGEFQLFERLGIELARVLHAEQEYTYGEPIRPGNRIRFSTSLVQVLEKQSSSGGRMAFLTFETQVTLLGQPEKSAGAGRTTIVYRT